MPKRDPLFYDQLWSNSSLHRLSHGDRLELRALLVKAGDTTSAEMLRKNKHELDAEHIVAAQCISLARALRQPIFSHSLWKEDKFIKFLPDLIEALGKRLKRKANRFHRGGQAHKDIPRRHLIEACEFVRLKTGYYNDADLAELAKFYLPKTTRGNDVSEEWIADRRQEFRDSYPDLFLYLQVDVKGRIEEDERERKQLLDPLGLSNNPVVIQALQELVKKYGSESSEAGLSPEDNSTSP